MGPCFVAGHEFLAQVIHLHQPLEWLGKLAGATISTSGLGSTTLHSFGKPEERSERWIMSLSPPCGRGDFYAASEIQAIDTFLDYYTGAPKQMSETQSSHRAE
jgi:hypothetical protein